MLWSQRVFRWRVTKVSHLSNQLSCGEWAYNQLAEDMSQSLFLFPPWKKPSHKFLFYANKSAEYFWSSQCPQPVGVAELSQQHRGRGHHCSIQGSASSKAQQLLRCYFKSVNVSSSQNVRASQECSNSFTDSMKMKRVNGEGSFYLPKPSLEGPKKEIDWAVF